MPDVITPMTGVTAEKFLPSQSYNTPSLNQNMFSLPVRKDKKVMVKPTLLKGVSIQKLWNAVFADKTDFLQRYHDRRKEVDLNVGDWVYASDKSSGYRLVSLTTIVDVPKAGTPTPLVEAHRFVYLTTDEGKPMIVYQISSQTPNVPAGGSFRTEAYCEITADSAEGDATIAFWGNCRKMSLAFSAIQYIAAPRAIREMTAAYQLMVDMVQEDLCGGPLATATAPAAANDAASDAGGADSANGGDVGGGGEGGGAPSSVFQGVLLLLAVIITIALLRSTAAVSRAARQAALVSETVRGVESGAAVPSRDFFPATQEEALVNAAREAQLQTLRYRWLEQRAMLADVHSSITGLRWMLFLQFALILGIYVKVFVL